MAKNLKMTPVGIAEYPRVTGTPDTKFEEAGVWRVKLRFDNPADVAHILAEVDAELKKAMEAAKAKRAEDKKKDPKKSFKPLKFADSSIVTNEETGAVTIGFKMIASGVSKKTGQPWTRKPAVFDVTGKPLDASKQVGGGSKLKVSYELGTWDKPIGVGASLRLEAVQVIELVEFGQGDATYFGFKNEAPETDDSNGEENQTVGGEAAEPNDDF